MPTFGQIKLKLDSANTGPFLATVKRTIGGTANGNIHPFCVMDPDNDVIAAVMTTAPGSSTAGAVVRPVNAGGTNALNIQDGGNVISVDGPLTDAELRATAVPVSGTFWQATQPVSGTFWQATQPVSGPLTDAELRATAVPVSGTFWQATQPVSGTFWQATQPVSGTVNAVINNFPSTYPVTGTFWQATQPVSGPLTDAELRATPVPVTASFDANKNEDAPFSNGATGAFVLGVRQDTLGSSSSNDGDYVPPKFNAAGEMYVVASGVVSVSNFPGTYDLGNVAKSEDAASANGATGVLMIGVRQDSLAGSSSDDGDYVWAKFDSLGRLYTNPSTVTQTVTGPLTDTQLRATAVPVSGPLTDTQLRATSVPVTPQVAAAEGATPGRIRSGAASENATVVKGSAGCLTHVTVCNWSSNKATVFIYDKATTPSSGDTAVQEYVVPGHSNGAGGSIPLAVAGLHFSSGISMRITLGDPSVGGNTAADQIVVNYGYK